MSNYQIAVLPGDGIGTEIMSVCIDLLNYLVSKNNGLALDFAKLPAGAECYRQTNAALPAATLNAARNADAILLGAMGLPDIRYPDGTEIAPQLDLRFELELYAGVRPVRCLPKLPLPLRNPDNKPIDFVLIRESTEGLFASHGKGEQIEDREARDTMVITRRVSEKLFNFAFDLAQRRKAQGYAGHLTCVDKANVFNSMAFFRKIFNQCAAHYPDIPADCTYVDATALNMVKQPWNFDVLVTENMFGDILSDLGAGLMGGMGMAPSADIGDQHAVFQPCHGTAPDIVGTGKANPTAMILSAAMMMEWLYEKHDDQPCLDVAKALRQAVDNAYSDGKLIPCEMGGSAGTAEIINAINTAIR